MTQTTRMKLLLMTSCLSAVFACVNSAAFVDTRNGEYASYPFPSGVETWQLGQSGVHVMPQAPSSYILVGTAEQSQSQYSGPLVVNYPSPLTNQLSPHSPQLLHSSAIAAEPLQESYPDKKRTAEKDDDEAEANDEESVDEGEDVGKGEQQADVDDEEEEEEADDKNTAAGKMKKKAVASSGSARQGLVRRIRPRVIIVRQIIPRSTTTFRNPGVPTTTAFTGG